MTLAEELQERIDKTEAGYKVEPITVETLKEWRREHIQAIQRARRAGYNECLNDAKIESKDPGYI